MFCYVITYYINYALISHTISNQCYTDIRYNEQMEDLMDKAYERFVIRKEGSAKQRKRIKKSYDAKAQLLEVWIFF